MVELFFKIILIVVYVMLNEDNINVIFKKRRGVFFWLGKINRKIRWRGWWLEWWLEYLKE